MSRYSDVLLITGRLAAALANSWFLKGEREYYNPNTSGNMCRDQSFRPQTPPPRRSDASFTANLYHTKTTMYSYSTFNVINTVTTCKWKISPNAVVSQTLITASKLQNETEQNVLWTNVEIKKN